MSLAGRLFRKKSKASRAHTISITEGIASCAACGWTGLASKLQEHLAGDASDIKIVPSKRLPLLNAEGFARPRDDESEGTPGVQARRDFLRKAALGGAAAAAAYGLSRLAQPAQAAPGDGISGVTISPGSVDAKRIGGFYFAENYDSAKHAGTDADPWSIAAIDGALAAIGSTNAVLVLTGVHNITSNRTIPVNVLLDVAMGRLKVQTGVTLTINGPLEAPLSQIFSLAGTGVVAFAAGSVKEFYPQWWGAKGDGVTDDTAAIQAALNASAGIGILFFAQGTYRTTSGIAINDTSNVHVYGIPGLSVIKPAAGTVGGIFLVKTTASPSNALNYCTIIGIKVDGSNLSDSGTGPECIGVHGYNHVLIQDCEALNFPGYGMAIGSGGGLTLLSQFCANVRVVRPRIIGCGGATSLKDGIGGAGVNGGGIYDGYFSGNTVDGINVAPVKGFDVIGNEIKGSPNGILFDEGVSDSEIAFNKIHDLTSPGAGGAAAISLGGISTVFPQKNVKVHHNAIKDSTYASLNGIQFTSIKSGATIFGYTGCHITENTIDNIGLTAIIVWDMQYSEIRGNIMRTIGGTGIRSLSNGSGGEANLGFIRNIIDENIFQAVAGFAYREEPASFSDFNQFIGNDVLGSAGVSYIGINDRVVRNPGFNPQGIAAITVTASPFTYTNNDGVPEAIYIRGGTVSDISKNATTIFTQTEQTVWLEPGEAVVVTYTVAPTLTKDRK